MNKIIAIIATLALSACAQQRAQTPTAYFNEMGLNQPTHYQIEVCRGYGCQYIDTIRLSDNTWDTIKTAFTPPPETPEQEREAIKTVIAELETLIGSTNGTSADVGGTFKKVGDTQLDCVDESTNTTTYLYALQTQGLIQFHEILPPAYRIPIIHSGRWPHQSAQIKDTQNNIIYVVDSWFHDNGKTPEIVPLEEWNKGWRPPEANSIDE